jgi:hypothetical protein
MKNGRHRRKRQIPARFKTKKVPGKEVSLSEPLLGKDKVWFTRHAIDRMKLRRIEQSEVFATLRNPTRKGLPTQPHRERWRKKISVRSAIDVVFERWPDKLAIVTVILIRSD